MIFLALDWTGLLACGMVFLLAGERDASRWLYD
jgi:hypothetical protein